jgi:hypothetical protein
MADVSWDDILGTADEAFNILPEGQYQAVIRGAESKVSKKNNEMVACTIKVSEGPYAGKGIDTVYVSRPGPGTEPDRMEGAVSMFMRHLKGLGISFDTLKAHKPSMAQIARVVEGKQITIVVKHEEFPKGSGVMQAKHQGPLRAPASGAVEVTSFPPVAATASAGSTPAGGFSSDPGF